MYFLLGHDLFYWSPGYTKKIKQKPSADDLRTNGIDGVGMSMIIIIIIERLAIIELTIFSLLRSTPIFPKRT